MIHSQIASVLLGEIISLLSSLFFELLLGDATSSLSLVHLVKSSKDILDRTRTAIDLVFYKQQAVALASTSSSRAQQFRRAGRSRTLSGSLIDLLTRPVGQASSDVVARLGALEDEEAILAGRCRSCLSDIADLSFITKCILVQNWFVKASEMQMVNYDLLPQQIHGLFLQACALAHITPLNDEDWRRSIGVSFQKVRGSLATALESLKFVLDCLKIVGSPGGDRCQPLERLCDVLEDARSELQKAWKAVKGGGGGSLHSAAALCQGFDSIVVEMASFTVFYLQWLKVEEKEGELQERLSQLLNASPLCMEMEQRESQGSQD